MKTTVERILREELGHDTAVREIVKLHGDASYRTYSRVLLADNSTMMLMQMPAGRASASEEITNFKGAHTELPFINVQRFLASRGIPVPRIYAYSATDHLMLLEDLGDDLMACRVEKADDTARRLWYGKATDLLVALQRGTAGADPAACVALQRSFDATLLNWEFDHFLEYGIAARLGHTMSDEDLAVFTEETRAVSALIETLPRGFTHRDFQSRNLIVRDGALALIDFQDALVGPRVYDLVALLRDSYVQLSPAIVAEIVARFARGTDRDEEEVRAEFDLVTIQRKLKDAGRFVYIDRVKKNPHFLSYIPASLGYVREAFERRPEFGKLYGVLRNYVPEWR